jgi:hypothetical protein
VALLGLSLMLWAGNLSAGPVAGDEAGPADAVQHEPSALPTPSLGQAPAAAGAAKSTAPETSNQTLSPGALAAEIIKEAQAEAGASETARPTPRPAAVSPVVRAAPSAPPDDAALRQWGKTAVNWFKYNLPWLRNDEDDAPSPKGTLSNQADWVESPLAGGIAGRGGRGEASPISGTTQAAPGPQSGVGYGSAPSVTPAPQTNLIREFIDAVRVVLEHPMTWLVVALFVIGGYAMSKFDRRPK